MTLAPAPFQLSCHDLSLLGAVVRRAARHLTLPSSSPLSNAAPTGAESIASLPADPSAAYESLLASDPSRRKSAGSFYTPAPIVNHLLDLTLTPILRATRTPADIRALRICDPACGAGNFLLAAFDRLAAAHARASRRATPTLTDRRAALACIRGVDIDPIAAELCRISLWLRTADPNLPLPTANIQTADSLLADWPALFSDVFPRAFDLVIGNPPFLNQLDAATAHAPERTAALKRVFGDAVRPYTDPAALFLLLSSRIARRAGRIALIEPQSILASRDAAPIRERLADSLEGLWIAPGQLFDANVRVCAPILRIDAKSHHVRRWSGPDFEPLPEVPPPTSHTWAPLAATGIPDIRIAPTRTLADLATATADFRDQYYGLRGHIVEDAALNGDDRSRYPRLITSGLIEPARCMWGLKPTRFDRRPFAAPRVNLDSLNQTDLAPWAAARLVPKILLATQTRLLEPAIDARGRWLPAVPVITIVPKDPADLWLLAAAILSPVASAWALRHFGGAGLSHDAIKLSAKQTLQIPLPVDLAPWRKAAAAARQAAESSGPDRQKQLLRTARLACAAHRLTESDSQAIISWWQARAKW